MTLIRWKKSSYSGNQGECVELAHTLDAVRDSKRSDGPTLKVDLSCMLAAIKAGHLDR